MTAAADEELCDHISSNKHCHGRGEAVVLAVCYYNCLDDIFLTISFFFSSDTYGHVASISICESSSGEEGGKGECLCCCNKLHGFKWLSFKEIVIHSHIKSFSISPHESKIKRTQCIHFKRFLRTLSRILKAMSSERITKVMCLLIKSSKGLLRILF